jgi:hypothetical protein
MPRAAASDTSGSKDALAQTGCRQEDLKVWVDAPLR